MIWIVFIFSAIIQIHIFPISKHLNPLNQYSKMRQVTMEEFKLWRGYLLQGAEPIKVDGRVYQ